MVPAAADGVRQPAGVIASWRNGDRDGAIEAGLMALDAADPGLSADDALQLRAIQAALHAAWAARERHRQRSARLSRRAAERDRRRTPGADPQTGAGAAPAAGAGVGLPPAAAAALARAKARAAMPR
ncbi:MAG TPA: hypothetical protein VLK29_00125 [Luteimonas sp.]|nr:hypothetical protein [Luteimonas sp.]